MAEVAAQIRVHPETVRRWLRQGRMRGLLPGGDRGGYRVRTSEVERFLKDVEREPNPPAAPTEEEP